MIGKSPKPSVVRYNNVAFCHLFGAHLDNCPICDIHAGHYCTDGMHLRMLLGRTAINGARYDSKGFPVYESGDYSWSRADGAQRIAYKEIRPVSWAWRNAAQNEKQVSAD